MNISENEKQIFDLVMELCCKNAEAIDTIARKFNISQDLVAKMFITTFQTILNNMEEHR